MAVPFLDLKAQYETIRDEVLSAIHTTLDRTSYILGPDVTDFENRFAAYCGARFGIGVNSGTSALQLALLAMGVGPGDEVILPPNTFIATAEAVSMTGARPVLVDIDPATFHLDLGRVEKAITPKTKAIIPVHLYGLPVDMPPLMELARAHGLKVIEDACQAHGAELGGRKTGSLGDAACFSFYPSKNLGAFGEGGLVVTSDEKVAAAVRALRDHGQTAKSDHRMIGYNARMEGIQGAVLGVKLNRLDGWNESRRQIAVLYDRLLSGTAVHSPMEPEGRRHVYHLYVVRLKNRDKMIKCLADRGIGTAIHYPVPIHLQEAYRFLGYRPGDFPEAEAAAGEILSLPMFPEMTEAMVNETAEGLREGLR